MKLGIRRVVLFAANVEALAEFYEGKLGLKVLTREKGFIDLDAGPCRLALHAGRPKPSRNKFCFYVRDVSATRQLLIDRGVKMGVDPGPGPGIKLCDGRDPAGNVFQLSNRK